MLAAVPKTRLVRLDAGPTQRRLHGQALFQVWGHKIQGSQVKWTPGKMEVRRKGRRYWASGPCKLVRGGFVWWFWSDHAWPFFHGHLQQPRLDRAQALEAFRSWLPFDAEPAPPQ